MRALLSDNGPQFVSEVLQQLCTIYGIKKVYASPYHPRGNALVESYMRTLKSTLILCTTKFKDEWDVVLPAAAFAYRATPHSTTGFSPYFLVVGQDPVLPLSREWEEPVLCPRGASWFRALWQCRRHVLDAHREAAKARAAAFVDAAKQLAPGMVVAVRLTPRERAQQGKFAPLYQGPFVVDQVLAHGTSAKLLDPCTGEERIANRVHLKIIDAPPPKAKFAKLPRWLGPVRR